MILMIMLVVTRVEARINGDEEMDFSKYVRGLIRRDLEKQAEPKRGALRTA